jgi:uncharacterized protein (TIGR04255 family)
VDAASANLFTDEMPEIHLPDAPLVKVLAQVRYPQPLDFEGEITFEPLGKALGRKYPVARKVQATAIVLTPDGVKEQPSPEINWTYQDIAGDWQVSVSGQFLSLETRKYTSRTEFCDRVLEAIEALTSAMHPPVYDRLGVRYVNRLEGEDTLNDLGSLVRPVAQAALVIPHADAQIQHSLCDTIFIGDNSQIQARWGWLPAGTGIDPTIPPPKVPYWLLDIDSYTTSGGPFDVNALDNLTRDLSARAYKLFRWLITDEFIKRFGGRI